MKLSGSWVICPCLTARVFICLVRGAHELFGTSVFWLRDVSLSGPRVTRGYPHQHSGCPQETQSSSVLPCDGYLFLLSAGLNEMIAVTDFILGGGANIDYLIISLEN